MLSTLALFIALTPAYDVPAPEDIKPICEPPQWLVFNSDYPDTTATCVTKAVVELDQVKQQCAIGSDENCYALYLHVVDWYADCIEKVING